MITVGSIFLVGCGESSLENSKYLVAGLDWWGGGGGGGLQTCDNDSDHIVPSVIFC